MVGRPQVSIRIGTSGRSDVEKDFAAIGDAGDQQARRYQAAWERASAAAESALDKQAKAATRLQSVGASPLQQQINSLTSAGGNQAGTAKAAATALAQELDRAESEARQLIAAIDPLFAAQSRYTAQVERINAVKATGQLGEARYQQLLTHEKVLLDEATAAAVRSNAVRGQTRAGFQQLSFQVGDVAQQLALGTRASIIFAQQSGQVIQAFQIMGGEGNAFLKLLGGPWGLALSTAAVVLTPFIGKLFDTGNAADAATAGLEKQARQEGDSEVATRRFADSIDGTSKALRDNRKALDDLADADKTAARRALESAIAQTERARRIRETTVALLAQAEAELRAAQSQTFGAAGGAGAGAAVSIYSQQLGDLQRQRAEAEADLAKATAQTTEALSFRLVELGERDPIQKIKDRYAELIEQTRQRAVAEHQVGAELNAQVAALKKREDAEVKAAQAVGRSGYSNRETGRQVSFAEAEAIARAGGLRVNSGYRQQFGHGTPGHATQEDLYNDPNVNRPGNPVAKPGTSAHGGANGKWAIDIQITDGVTPAKIRQIYGAQGISLSKVFKENGHFHIEGSRSEAAAGERAEDKAKAEALRATDAFDTERGRLNQQLLQELGRVAQGYEAQATVQLRQVQAEHDNEQQDIATSLAQGKYGEATSQLAQTRAAQLQQANDDLLKGRQASINADRDREAARARDEADAQAAGFRIDQVQYEQSIARSTADRQRLSLESLDLQYQEKQQHLEYLKSLADLAGNTAEAARLQAEINDLPREKANDQDSARRQNASPWQAYLDSLPKSIGEINDELEKAAVNGLQDFNQGLVDAALNGKSLADVFHNVAEQILADLLRLAEQEALHAIFGGGQQGGSGGGSGSIFGSILSGLVSIGSAIFGGGGFNPNSAANLEQPSFGVDTNTLMAGNATGTEYASGGLSWVGENGKELMRLPRGSKVYSAANSSRMAAANDGGPSLSLAFHNDFRGADASAVDGISARLDRFEREFPGRVLQSWQDARSRFAIRGPIL